MNTRNGMLLLAMTAVMLGAAGCGREEAEKAQKELDDAKASLAKLQDEVKATQKSFSDLETRYKDATEELRTARKSAADVKTRLKAVEKQSASARDDANAKLADAQTQIDALKNQIVQLKKDYSICQTEQKSAVAMAAQLRRENTQLRADLEKRQEEVRQLRGIKPSPTDKPAKADDENLPKIPPSAPTEKLPDPTNPSE